MKTRYHIRNRLSFLVAVLFVLAAPNNNLAQYKPGLNRDLEIIPDRPAPSKVEGTQRIEAGSGIVRAMYSPDFTAENGEPREMAEEFLKAKGQPLMLKSDVNDLEHVRTVETPGGYKVHFIQMAAGYPVYGSRIKVSINHNNEVVFVTNSYKPVGELLTAMNISPDQAMLSAKNYVGIQGRTNLEKTESVVYCVNRLKSVVAYKISIIPAEDHFGDWEVIVDAGTGEILRAEDKGCYYHPEGVQTSGSGWVFDPDPITNATTEYGAPGFTDNNDADSDSLTAQLKTVTLQDLTFDGSLYWLNGPYAAVVDFGPPFTGTYEQSSSDFHFTRSNAAFEAVNAYYHIDNSMRYINDTLGFDVMPIQYEGGVQFDPHGLGGLDNSFYHAFNGIIEFGDGGVDDAEDYAVVIHELGHGLHDWITNGGLSRLEGLGEGLADYWAMQYARSLPYWTPGDPEYDWVFTWDGHNEFWSGRTTNYTAHFPEGLTGNVYTDGQMWSSSLMLIFDSIGREATNMDCWEGISMLDINSGQVDAAYAFAMADKELYDGAHLETIYNVFRNRGYFQFPVIPTFIAGQPNGEGPREVVFTDESFSFFGDIVSWEWDLDGDGQIDSYDQNPAFTYNDVGAYTVALTVSDGQNTESLVKENYITVNSGVFVFEKKVNEPDFSGTYIRGFLEENGYTVIYSNYYPTTFEGFDAVFLSFGNSDAYLDKAIVFDKTHADVITEYLENGGKLYIDGGNIMGMPDYLNWENKDEFFDLFGVESVDPLTYFNENMISSLEGQDGTLAEGMLFTESTQVYNYYIDQLTPVQGAMVPFIENNYGNVSIYNEGDLGQRTFYLGYSLADLVDIDPHSSRYNLLYKILNFMGYQGGENYVVANFVVDNNEVLPGEEVQFIDWSFSAEGTSVESWAWDFDEDGNIDSEYQNPAWTYDDGGYYDVMLIVFNGENTDTLVREDAVLVKSGMFVYEVKEEGVDHSGTFIKDYLEDGGYDVIYSIHFPSSLSGFDAVFASFGSGYYTGPSMTGEIADALKSYGQQGGRIYLEGADAFGYDQAGNNLLQFVFGLENTDNGSTNAIDLLQGQEGTIMEGMEFSASSQLDINSIDLYNPNPDLTTAQVAFEESDYGAVAVQYDGTEIYGQKTFSMSYSLASLEDGIHPNTRNVLLNRILEFFDQTTGINEEVNFSEFNAKVYPNPARDHINLAFKLEKESDLQINIYNLIGQKVICEPQKMFPSGRNEVQIGTNNLIPGTYFYQLISQLYVSGGKFIIVK